MAVNYPKLGNKVVAKVVGYAEGFHHWNEARG